MPSYADSQQSDWSIKSKARSMYRIKLLAKGVTDGGSKMMSLMSRFNKRNGW